MKVLVTGATGFLGSWMVRGLVEAGHEVKILHRKSSDLSLLGRLQVESCLGDVTDIDSVQNACRGVHSVFHLAGVVGYSKTARDLMEKVNVQGTSHVVKACQDHQIKRLVHMSSVVAVGASFDKSHAPLNEDSHYTVNDLNLGYFETKRKAELMVKDAVNKGLVDAVILNPSTIYGPGDARKGSRSTQLKVARGKMPFYSSGGVSVIAVEDVVKATYTAWEKGRAGERYILSGDNVTIKQLFDMIAAEAGVKPPYFRMPDPLIKVIGHIGDAFESMGHRVLSNSENAWTAVLFHWFDSSKAKRELGLVPKPAQACIAQSVQWMKQNGCL